MNSDRLDIFWEAARAALPELPTLRPQAWGFGATTGQNDELLELVLSGVKTATASSGWDYEADSEPLPQVGQLDIVLDGNGEPRALIENVDVRIVPFEDVGAEHAAAEGEGDRTLAWWREAHEAFWREHSSDPRGFAPDMPVVCERFRVLFTH